MVWRVGRKLALESNGVVVAIASSGFAYGRINLVNGIVAVVLTWPVWLELPPQDWIVPTVYLGAHVALYFRLRTHRGRELNKQLGMTAVLMLFYAAGYFLSVI